MRLSRTLTVAILLVACIIAVKAIDIKSKAKTGYTFTETRWDNKKANDFKYLLKKFASFAFASYCPEAKLKSRSCTCPGAGFDIKKLPAPTVKSFSIQLLRYAIWVDQPNKQIIVSFRGTTKANDNGVFNPSNLLTDLNLKQTYNPVQFLFSYFKGAPVGMRLHQGFNDAIKTVEGPFFQQLKDLMKTRADYSVIFTGHSLGGALATLAATLAISNHEIAKSKVYLYTYGSPRVGNKQFSDWFNGEAFMNNLGCADIMRCHSYRVVSNEDPIPSVPVPHAAGIDPTRPGDVYQNYHHVGREVWFQGNKFRWSADPDGEDRNGASQYITNPLKLGDHNTYIGVSYCS